MTIRSAIILAAGRGSRLDAHTARRPKCLVSLGGRCLLDWQIDALHAAGIDDIAIVAGYRAERVSQVARVPVKINPAWQSSGPVASLLAATPAEYRDGFLLVYADSLFHPSLIGELRRIPDAIGLTVDVDWHALWSARFEHVLDDAESLRYTDGRLLEIGARADSVEAIQGQFTGLVKFSAAGWSAAQSLLDALPPSRTAAFDMTSLLAALLARGERIGVAPVAGRWCEVDSASDLALYRRSLRRRRWSHDWRWTMEGG